MYREELFLSLKKGLMDLAMEVESGSLGLSTEQKANARASIYILNEYILDGRRKKVIGRFREELIPAKEQHFNRNQNMPPALMPVTPGEARLWGWDDGVAADCHQFTSPDKTNVKFVSPDGKLEVIFDKNGKVVTASEDYGTYNFANPKEDPIGHFYMDVLPWLVWGNDETDSTDLHLRLRTFVLDGGMNVLREKIKKK